MDNLQNEQDFSRIVREHKSTIYTVCYMFSKDEDEVNDLFQEVLINLWKGLQNFRGESDVRTLDLSYQSKHLHLLWPKETETENDSTYDEHQSLYG